MTDSEEREQKIEGALAALSQAQKAEITSGASRWSTIALLAVGLSAMLVGDRPLGLVSPMFDERETALLLPCGAALGATWDPQMVERVAAAQGSEARRRGYEAVYTPSLKLARTGLSGRTFEMFSEDPLLAGVLATAVVRGLRSQGVAACPKHLGANDTETQRQRMSSMVDDIALREVYLRPFEMALRDGGAWMVMAAYNRLNGTPCASNRDLLSIVKGRLGMGRPGHVRLLRSR